MLSNPACNAPKVLANNIDAPSPTAEYEGKNDRTSFFANFDMVEKNPILGNFNFHLPSPALTHTALFSNVKAR